MAADAGEIAKAWVTIMPSGKGMAKGIEQELGGVGEKAGKTAGKGFAGGLGKATGMAVKVAGGAVAAVGGIIAGIGLKGGFDRALNIEQAEAKLSGLGHSAKSVEKIMANASAAVKGTAFGLGDAATVAASAVAAGIKPGKDLEKNLTLVGDAAAIAGTDMGSMGAVFNKVAASNKLQGDVIAQLHDAGIPALQLVAKEMGVTAEEASDMASKGKIDFATFSRAMEKGMGGAAQKAGQTFTGAIANTKAALGRVGETVLTPFLEAITRSSGSVIPIIDSVNEKLKPIMASFGEWLSGVDFSGSFGKLADIFGQVWAYAEPVLSMLGKVFGPIIPQVVELVSSLSPMSMLFQSLVPVMPMITQLLMQVSMLISSLVQAILPLVTQLAEFLIPLFTELWTAILPPLIGVMTQLVTALQPVIQALGPILQQVLTALMPVVTSVFGIIQNVITNVLAVISSVISAFSAALSGDWEGFWNSIADVCSGIWNGITDLAVGIFSDLPGKILGALGNLGSLLLDAGSQILGGFLNGLKAGWDKVTGFISGIGPWIAEHKGPKQYDLNLLVPAGGWIMSGLNKGLDDSMPSLGDKLSDVSWMIQNGIDPDVPGLSASASLAGSVTPVTGTASSLASVGSGGDVNVYQDIKPNDTEAIAQEVVGRMRFLLGAQGVKI